MSWQFLLSLDGLITALAALIFGVIVLFNNRKNVINQTGFLLTAATALWAFGYWQWLLVYDNKESALFWVRILSVGSTLIPLFYFHWITCLLNLNKEKKRLIILCYLLALIFLCFSFSPFYIKEVNPALDFPFWPKAGFLYSFYLLFVYFGLVVYSVYLLLKNYKSSAGLKREQIRYVLLGSVVGFGGGATNFFLWYNIEILPLGNFLVIFYPIIFSYSIIRHRLMDIKIVLRRSTVFFSSLTTVVILAALIKYFSGKFLAGFDLLTELIILILALLIFPRARSYFFRLANKYFFSSLYDGRLVIAGLSEKLSSTLEIKEIYEFIAQALLKNFHLKAVGILAYNKKRKIYLVEKSVGFKAGQRKFFKSDYYLHSHYITKDKFLITEELRNSSKKGQGMATIKMLTDLKVAVLIPLNIKTEVVGLLALGEKESGDMFNGEDLETLSVIGAQAAIAIENARLYKEVKDFNVKLREEVEQATAELRKANAELKQLDQAKSDFISIASHQLRTPLTVTKGYVSMILDGDFGGISLKVRDSLAKVFEANEHLVQLVENLLSLSRLESGRMQYVFEKTALEEIVKNVVATLENTARNKNLRLIYERAEKPLPPVMADREKIRNAVLNLIDNAIKYTKEGEVVVNLAVKGGEARLTVKDTGIGFDPQEQINLFKRFSRGRGSSTVNTEGTGLGLYVSKTIVDAHGGKIWAESAGRGKGSIFCLSLPLAKEKK